MEHHTPARGQGGMTALVLPALSSIATKDEMAPLAAALGGRLAPRLVDWPGFGAPRPAGASLAPGLLHGFLDRLLGGLPPAPLVGIAAGHGATYLAMAAGRHPERFAALVLVAPTWRGPLPTMTDGGRPGLRRGVRRALEMPGLGPLLFGLNLSRPAIGWMMREHVYAEAARVTPAVVAAKAAVARRPGARLATAAFVTGGLDPLASREAFLALFAPGALPPALLLRPRGAPRRSGAEMDALAATGRVAVAAVDGALAAHEERPAEVAEAVLTWLDGVATAPA